jgi:glycosyltransferase involved in cell wall biosynthesis
MKILFVADANSILARNWISFFAERGDEVEVVCLFPVMLPLGPQIRIYEVPLLLSQSHAFSASGLSAREKKGSGIPALARIGSKVLRHFNSKYELSRFWWGYVGPIEARRVAAKVQRIADHVRPDIVHGLRIPMEGESLAKLRGYPLVVSIWGNDLTLWAARYKGHRLLTRLTLGRTDGLHADCQRDIRLARTFGYDPAKPSLVSPGGGGIRVNWDADRSLPDLWRRRLNVHSDAPVVINPRGVRAYVNTEEYLQAIPEILRAHPDTIFISVGVSGDPSVSQRVKALGIEKSVLLLPQVSQDDLMALFRMSDVLVSPSAHDGTPNTLLEGMAGGCFPVAGDIESIREWIKSGENGLLMDPASPRDIAAAVVHALGEPSLRTRAAEINARIIKERAEYESSMSRVRDFYMRIISGFAGSPAERANDCSN